MNKLNQDTLLLEKLLEKYKFTRPVPGDIRTSILASKKKNFVRVLKTVGAFSAVYGVLLSIYFSVKKLGIAIPISKFIISGITVASVSYGGYYAVVTLTADKESGVSDRDRTRSADEIKKKYKWVDRIMLYNGRVVEGAIISRGEDYMVLTANGVLHIPRKQIKTVTPLKIEVDAKTK